MNKFPREILNEIKWRFRNLQSTEIYYESRGAPNDIASVKGYLIKDVGGFGITLDTLPETVIPHHRIRKIIYKEEEVFNYDIERRTK